MFHGDSAAARPQETGRGRRGHGSGEEIALPEVAAGGAQPVGLRAGLDTLGDDADPQAVGERDDGIDDRAVRHFVEAEHERAVDLEHVERQVLEVGERRVARPEVVEDEPHTEVAQSPQ